MKRRDWGWAVALLLWVHGGAVLAEGSFQVGLNQALREFDRHRNDHPLHVDILRPGEVINVSACGRDEDDVVRVRIYSPSGERVLSKKLYGGNVACDSPMDAPLRDPLRYVTREAGVHSVTLESLDYDEEEGILRRFDVTVTPDDSTYPDPTASSGRLWAKVWLLDGGTFAASGATDADFFILVPGGRPSTNYVWMLDLNRFAGYLYWIRANDIGVDPPYSGSSISWRLGDVTPRFPIYLSYPEVAQSRPTRPPIVGDFHFVDDVGQDHTISPAATRGVQDSGWFRFASDVSGTYAITIDSNRDGVYGAGDVLLLGRASVGDNEVHWDGRDVDGDYLPEGDYRARLQLRLGEYHFIATDVETSGGDAEGLTIFLANPDGTREPTRVYWDDATYLGGTTTLPDGALSSTPAGRHTWGDFSKHGFGNERHIDTYVYGLESEATTLLAIRRDDVVRPGQDGTIEVTPASRVGGAISVAVEDGDLDVLAHVEERIVITVLNERSGETEQVVLVEEGPSGARFLGLLDTASTGDAISNDGRLVVLPGDTLLFTYHDRFGADGRAAVRQVRHVVGIDGDGDGVVDSHDIDGDNDAIPDTLEGDGAVDSDGDGTSDARDLDSDGDGLSDLFESGLAAAATLDDDGDGRIDPSHEVGANGLADTAESAPDSGTIGYVLADSDGDGVADFRDLDSDNDGIPDAVEGGGDGDGDGIADFRDLDSDGDGLFDLVEAGGADGDGDGRVDGFTDSDGDGLDDRLAATPLPLTGSDGDGDGAVDFRDPDSDGDGIADGAEGWGDSDGDGVADFRDLDSDNDAIPDAVEGWMDDDGDGVPNARDPDSDDDGLFDLIESGLADAARLDGDGDGRIDPVLEVGANGLVDAAESTPDSGTISYTLVDTDGDGRADFRDADSDGDGIFDGLEGLLDGDGDGIADLRDLDSDGDGVPDTVEGSVDSDGDGVADFRDLDSDGDGLSDLIESGLADIARLDGDGDGRIDPALGVGANGLADAVESAPDSGTIGYVLADSDGDGVADFRDLDSDNDAIPDAIEGLTDSDGDGVSDRLDLDSDNDGLFDLVESGLVDTGGFDEDGDGRIDSALGVGANGLADVVESAPDSGTIGYTLADSDGDGIADFRDLDSDGDGLSDVVESGGADPDGDGRLGVGTAVVDEAGLLPGAGLVPQDSDGDGVVDFRDNDDSDGDGVPDRLDLDSDNDGIPDAVEGGGEIDSDGDGTPDYLDTDSDGDGLSDLVEAGGVDGDGDGRVDGFTDSDGDGLDDRLAATPLPLTDSDGDGTPDHLDNRDSDDDGVVDSRDLDSDNDGIPDAIEGDAAIDSDGDGVADFRDLDSDNDGVTDLIESGLADPAAFDADGNGRIDAHHDVGANGLADDLESSVDSGLSDYDGDGRGADPVADSDGDGTPDYLALDSDGDGLGDLAESGGLDSDGDGRVDDFIDDDGDGLDDRLATSPLSDLFRDGDGDGIVDRRDNDDADGDGVADVIDLDDDNDGIPDVFEGDGTTDTDGDGVPDSRDPDSDDDGLFDLVESGLADARGLDEDGDGRIDPAREVGMNGLADVVESAPDSGTIGYTLADSDGDGIADFRDLDSDNDAIPDAVEGRIDSDRDGTLDFRDLDSDDDGLADLIESGLADAGGLDEDGDGRIDPVHEVGTNGLADVAESAPDSGTIGYTLADSDGNGLPDYRDRGDLDGDGVPDARDLDDDNDGIPDALEGAGAVDSDGDGVDDSRDLDSDNDGLFDLVESGLADAGGLDEDGDGRIDPAREVGTNGLADAAESTPDSGTIGYILADSDGDGVADFRDLDSDNDGVADVVEAGGTDPDHDGRLGEGGGVDGDGVLPGAGLSPSDSDGDGVADFRDLDSDDDGLSDLIEGGGTDTDGDGRFDGFIDTDGDGLDDRLPLSPLPLPDHDGDGLDDRVDRDSDGDGVSDLIESGGTDRDLDGRVDDPVDSDGDGFDDRLATAPLELPDSDNDGLADHLDRDSAREPPVVRTGLDGVGGCTLATGAPFDPTLLALLAGAWLGLRRRRRHP